MTLDTRTVPNINNIRICELVNGLIRTGLSTLCQFQDRGKINEILLNADSHVVSLSEIKNAIENSNADEELILDFLNEVPIGTNFTIKYSSDLFNTLPDLGAYIINNKNKRKSVLPYLDLSNQFDIQLGRVSERFFRNEMTIENLLNALKKSWLHSRYSVVLTNEQFDKYNNIENCDR